MFSSSPEGLKVFDELNELNLLDFRIDSFGTSKDGDEVLSIHGTTSIYYTVATVRFQEVEFMSVSTGFHHARFRSATAVEVTTTRRLGEFDCNLFAIDVDFENEELQHTLFVAAASVQVAIAGWPKAPVDWPVKSVE